MENKRIILLTGSSGFLGSRILSRINKNNIIYLLTSKNKIEKLESNHIQITIDDLNKIDNIDEIIHCAGVTRGKSRHIWDVNYNLTKRLIAFCKKHNAYFLFISSLNAGLVYKGDYEKSKYEAERVLINSYNNFLIIRPSYLFDTNYEPNLKFLNRFLFVFKCIPILLIAPRDLLVQPLHVDDLAYFCKQRLEKKDYKGEIIEVAGPHNKSIWDVIRQYFLQNRIDINFIKISYLFFTPLCFCFKNKMNILFQDRILIKNKEKISFTVEGDSIVKI